MIYDSPINTGTRVGRMLDALVSTDDRRGVVVVTVSVFSGERSRRYHETFAIRRWKGKDGGRFLTVSIHKSGDWKNDVRPISCLHMNLSTGEVFPAKDKRAKADLLQRSALVALHYAWTGHVGNPGNGSFEVRESGLCGVCGTVLTDPVSIELGVGRVCDERRAATRSRTIRSQIEDDLFEQMELTPVA